MVKNKYKVEKKLSPKQKNPKAISSIIGQNEFNGLAGFEEISTCTLVKKTKLGVKKTTIKNGKVIKKKKKKKSAKNNSPSEKPKYDKPKNLKKDKEELDLEDLSAWKDVFAPEPVIKSLAKLGFRHPTEIQRLTLPAAIKGRKDIIGAAETGSGKTLAFGIPVVHGILADMENEKQKSLDSGVEGSDGDSDKEEEMKVEDSDAEDREEVEDMETDVNEESTDNFQGLGCVKVIDNAVFDFLDEDTSTSNSTNAANHPLRALIVTPTRELAMQIKEHIDAILTNTSLKTAVVVGGMAQEKQERLLRKGPEIVVGTPGRLWELIQQGNPHLAQIYKIKYLVIDETDRMIEKGHFQQLQDLLELTNCEESYKNKRQTFVFSATLTLVHSGPRRFNMKKKVQKLTSQIKIENLMKIVGVKPKPKVIDVTRKFGTAETLTEARINCVKEDKDLYLYYLLKLYPGRTLVFCNSIDCVRRLQNLFTVLKCQPQSLHASMHQKQRIKSLERFSSNQHALLLATDVAARGLDIPNIQHVIHYQVPRTAETYIHRSGRTARACQEGLSVLLMDPSELSKYKHLCITLKRETELPPFPVDAAVMSQVRERVVAARNLEKMEYRLKKEKIEENWWKKAAEEAELILDDDESDQEFSAQKNHRRSKTKQNLMLQKFTLQDLLSKSIIPSNFSGKYPTSTGNLVTPIVDQQIPTDINSTKPTSALSIMKKEKDNFQDLISKVKIKAPVKRVNKKKYKGFEKRKLKLKKERELYKKQSMDSD